MIRVNIVIKGLNIDHTLFYIDAPKSLIKEVEEAFRCEQEYNDTLVDWDGLIYYEGSYKRKEKCLTKIL